MTIFGLRTGEIDEAGPARGSHRRRIGDRESGLRGWNNFDETHLSDIIAIAGLRFNLIAMAMPRTASVYARFNY